MIPDGRGWLSVTDDPKGVLRDFLGFATSPPEDGRPIEEKLTKTGGGIAWDDIMGAWLVQDQEALESDARSSREPWVVSRSFPSLGPASMLIEGDELRELLRQARSAVAPLTA